jgi:hypothetical protein
VNRRLAIGVDTRGLGGYVVGVGSRIAGWAYAYEDAEVPIAPRPDWIAERLRRPALDELECNAVMSSSGSDLAVLRKHIARVRHAVLGTRNDELNRSAFVLGGLLRADGLDPSEVVAHLLRAALDAGLSEGEARATIASGLKAGLTQGLVAR